MLLGMAKQAQHLKFLLNDHAPAILTGVGVAGSIATAYFSGRASFKASRIIDQEREAMFAAWREGESNDAPIEFTTTKKVKLVGKLYIPAAATGVVTIASIIAANKISSGRIAALVVASGISERAFQEYKDKVIEKLGTRQDEKIRDEIAQEKVNALPVGSREVIVTGAGEVLFFDNTSGRYFMSTMEDVRRAENRINYELINFMYASLSLFYDEIGLPPTSFSDSVGWNMANHLELKFSTTMSTDNRPCIVIDFSRQPSSDYAQKAWDS